MEIMSGASLASTASLLQSIIDEHKEALTSGLYKSLCDVSMSLHSMSLHSMSLHSMSPPPPSPVQLTICYPRKTITYGPEGEPILVLHTAAAVLQIELPDHCDGVCDRCDGGEDRCSWSRHILSRSGRPLRVETRSLLERLVRLRTAAAISAGSLLGSLFELEEVSLDCADDPIESECGTVVVIATAVAAPERRLVSQ